MPRLSLLLLSTCLMLAVSCGDDSSSPLVPLVGDDSIAVISLSVDGASLAVGETLQLSAVAKTARGASVEGVAFQWSSSDPTASSVTQAGLVTALATGTAEIRAAARGKIGTARIDTYVPVAAVGTIHINPTQRFQTMRGWQIGSDWGFEHPLAYTVREQILTRVAYELGIDRIRIPLRSGVENTRDWFAEYTAGTVSYTEFRCNWYATVNDNADPTSINKAGFHFTELDLHIENSVLPLRQLLGALGEELYVVLAYLPHTYHNCPGTQFHHTDAEEYAELLVTTFQHLRDKYGLMPDLVEVVNEPDWSWTFGSAPLSGMLAAAGRRLKAAGFNVPFMGPSTMSASRAIEYYDDMIAAPGNADLIAELSYHRYEGTTGDLHAIGTRANSQRIPAVMGERMGASVLQLFEDLTIAHAASWEQGSMAWYKHPSWTDDGGSHYWIDFSNPAAPTVEMGILSRPLRQYFRYVRRGAVRIAATSQNEEFKPVAFINTGGQYVVVIWTTASGSFTISGLPAGTYGINYTTNTQLNVEATAVTVRHGEAAPVSIPSAGVVTVYRK